MRPKQYQCDVDAWIRRLSISTSSLDLYVVSLSILLLMGLMGRVPKGCERLGRTEMNNIDTLNLSGLLNALDGVAAAEGRRRFVTANHLEKLNRAPDEWTSPAEDELQRENDEMERGRVSGAAGKAFQLVIYLELEFVVGFWIQFVHGVVALVWPSSNPPTFSSPTSPAFKKQKRPHPSPPLATSHNSAPPTRRPYPPPVPSHRRGN
ncbi:hypothetical protein C8F01DRAFT_1373815 [Mycena amicta]|nr:hypothetical protein C8F01DRAFT_1373815 [Mycena amicta]